MDNNFIKIDDLVRQRLAGGEEQERSGAWLRMQDLLDKEMPRERVVGIPFWRRTMSAVALLMLVAAFSLGGYEMNGYFRSLNGSGDALAAATPSTATAPAVARETGSEIPNSSVTATGENTAAAGAVHHTIRHSDKLINNNSINNNELPGTGSAASLVTAKHNTRSIASKEAHSTTATTGVPESADHKSMTPSETAFEVEKKERVKEPIKPTPVKSSSLLSATPSGADAKPVAVSTAPVKPAAAREKTKASNPVAVVKSHSASHKSGHVPAMSAKNTAPVRLDKMALGSSSTSAVPGAAGIPVKDVAMKAASTHPTMSAPVAEKAPAEAADKMAIASAAPVKLPRSSYVAPMKPATENIHANDMASKAAVPVTLSRSVSDNTATRNISTVGVKKGKKVVQKLVLLERYVKITPTEGYYHLDTISMEEFSEEAGLAAENKPYLPRGSKPAGTGFESGDNSAAAEGQILPGAVASNNSRAAMGNKENTAHKASGSGSSMLEKLSSAFNDIKYSAGGVKFSPGLAAGINGTFFGPSSFKGFQFGVTGTFVFSSEWSVLTGVEYFHRINGNYSLYDNYYDYTNVNGSWYKQEHLNWYSFSTLHSFELPVAARYTSGNFNFFAGANFAYTLAINTGEAQLPPNSNTASYQVATPGNDNAPKLNSSDFGARFGIGCLFGVSYQVAPNVTLDLRNVQTLWDNAKSPGSRFVSDQLYKSPSLQFSIGYRLGGNKDKK